MDLWIDYDISFGEIANEVDDGLALIHAVIAEEKLKTYSIKGISSVHGNTFNMKFQRKATNKLLKILEREDIHFYDGAGSASERGLMNPAVEALINLLEKGPVTILAMGRLTNIATVLILRPELRDKIEKLVIMGGRRLEKPIYFGNKNIEFPDLNIDGDLPSVKKVIAFKIPLLIIATECMTDQLIKKKHLILLAQGNAVTKLIAKVSKPWRLIWKTLLGSPDGFIPWDVFMISYLTHPEDFHIEKDIPCEFKALQNTTHHLYQFSRRKKIKQFLVVSHELDSKYKVDYCYKIDPKHTDKLIDFWMPKNI